MSNLTEKIFLKSPHFIQNILMSLYNYRAYKYRYGGDYNKYLEAYNLHRKLNTDALKKVQVDRFKEFITYAKNNSKYYNEIIPDNYIDSLQDIGCIKKLPFLKKEDIRNNIDAIRTIPKSEAIKAKTGGTTGISLAVYYTEKDIQKRAAHVDYHRNKRGYELGKKTAWFSGKKIINKRDINKKRFWKTDYHYKVRYYSTFHISPETTENYLTNLVKFKPEYLVGFPSSIYELAKAGNTMDLKFPNTVKAIFPNAETLSKEIRTVIEEFFNAKIYDQYGSSEGVPYIFEEDDGIYYHNPEVGIIEVLDEYNNPSKKGRLVVTSFYTEGTPLIRYEIGDYVEVIGDKEFPSAFKKIFGRSVDVIYTKAKGKINSVNIANCSKGVEGLVKFKLIQNKLGRVEVNYVSDDKIFTDNGMDKFVSNLKDRLGSEMKIKFYKVEDISKERSGKYRIIENNIDSKYLTR